jgi:hypothetical protein
MPCGLVVRSLYRSRAENARNDSHPLRPPVRSRETTGSGRLHSTRRHERSDEPNAGLPAGRQCGSGFDRSRFRPLRPGIDQHHGDYQAQYPSTGLHDPPPPACLMPVPHDSRAAGGDARKTTPQPASGRGGVAGREGCGEPRKSRRSSLTEPMGTLGRSRRRVESRDSPRSVLAERCMETSTQGIPPGIAGHVVAGSPELATWPTAGLQPGDLRSRSRRGLETRAEQSPTGNQEVIPGLFLKRGLRRSHWAPEG